MPLWRSSYNFFLLLVLFMLKVRGRKGLEEWKVREIFRHRSISRIYSMALICLILRTWMVLLDSELRRVSVWFSKRMRQIRNPRDHFLKLFHQNLKVEKAKLRKNRNVVNQFHTHFDLIHFLYLDVDLDSVGLDEFEPNAQTFYPHLSLQLAHHYSIIFILIYS